MQRDCKQLSQGRSQWKNFVISHSTKSGSDGVTWSKNTQKKATFLHEIHKLTGTCLASRKSLMCGQFFFSLNRRVGTVLNS